MLIVKKFGGFAVANKERIFNVARRCIDDYKKGNDVVVVLSAMGTMTDDLIKLAKDINPEPSRRELDMLMVTGEQTSVALASIAFHTLGVPAISLNAFQVAMHTTSTYTNARIKRIDTERIQNELDQRKIVIVTGFQGINKFGDYTTLGRGGSDTTAVAIAASLKADCCEIYTDVDGIYTADPRIVKSAKKMQEITYDEMLDLTTLGAGVLQNRSIELAKKYGVELVVRSFMTNEEGTVIKEDVKVERMLVSGVAADKNCAKISVVGLSDKPGTAFRLFDALSQANINVDMILQSVGRDNSQDIAFTVVGDYADDAMKVIEDNKKRLKFQTVECEKGVAKVSVVGAGMMSNPGVAAKVFECMYNSNINIKMISTSEIRVTVLIDDKEVERAMNAAHDIFGLDE